MREFGTFRTSSKRDRLLAQLLAAIAELQIKEGPVGGRTKLLGPSACGELGVCVPLEASGAGLFKRRKHGQEGTRPSAGRLKSYSDRNSSDPSGYLSRYQIFMKKAQFDKAQEELERIYTIYPKYPNLHYYKGVMYTNMGNHKLAAEEYETELKNNDLSVAALIALGKAKVEIGDSKGALTHLAKAMGLQPANADAKATAALANHRLKNFAGAVALYQAAIQVDSGNPLLYRRLGECYRDMGDLIAARGAFKKYLQMEPDAVDKAEIERYL